MEVCFHKSSRFSFLFTSPSGLQTPPVHLDFTPGLSRILVFPNGSLALVTSRSSISCPLVGESIACLKTLSFMHSRSLLGCSPCNLYSRCWIGWNTPAGQEPASLWFRFISTFIVDFFFKLDCNLEAMCWFITNIMLLIKTTSLVFLMFEITDDALWSALPFHCSLLLDVCLGCSNETIL